MFFFFFKPFIRQAILAKLEFSHSSNFLKLKSKDSRLFYIISGEGEIEFENRSYKLLPNTVILFKAGTEYEWKTNGIEYYSINFDYTQDFSDTKRTFHPFSAAIFDQKSAFDCGYIEDCKELNKPIVIYDAAILKRQIKNITYESVLTDKYSPSILSLMMSQIIIEILRIHNQENLTSPDNTQKIKQIIEYIHTNYSNNITNQNIADYFGYNSSYIGRLFKNSTGQTLHSYILEFRLQIAMELLTNRNVPIGEIYKQVGFTDFYHFSKMFKKKTGKTPTQYRSHHISIIQGADYV